jgi:hypothetical protein|uniref:Uncharacterized protein n=1 Tax=viral metagenome TaxID=1070528 RepID=A0A6C0EYP0_9ZZZZ
MGIYRIETIIVDWIGIFTFLIFALLFIGILQQKPLYFIEFVFLFKLFISIFLIYRFNDFRKNIKFTDLDRKVCFLAGINLLIISFADLIQDYLGRIKTAVKTFVKK